MNGISPGRILFVDDEPEDLRAFEAACAFMGEGWVMRWVQTGEQALTMMSQEFFDIIVAALSMPGRAQLLNEVMRLYPGTVRLILCGEADEDLIMQCVGAIHQVLTKPLNGEVLKTTWERIRQLKTRLKGKEIRNLVTGMSSLPSMPSVLLELVQALQSPYCSVQRLGEIVSQDPGLTAKLLQLVNSAFFGLARHVSHAETAVLLLGVSTIRSLALGLHLFSAFRPIDRPGFSAREIWLHSLRVGQLARKVVEQQGGNERLMEEAFTAGLLHDVRKLIMAQYFSERYLANVEAAQKGECPLVGQERATFGATHAEVGAYLLDLWGLPVSLVEAVALHHEPAQIRMSNGAAATAVYLANLIEHASTAADRQAILAQLQPHYLARLNPPELFNTVAANYLADDTAAMSP